MSSSPAHRPDPGKVVFVAILSLLVLAALVTAMVVVINPPSTTTAEAPAGELTQAEVTASLPHLDEIVTRDMARTGVPGVAVAVAYGNKVVYTKGYGVRSTKTGAPVDTHTVFQLASLSKPVSSTIMAGLVGQGTIAWDDPIVKYTSKYALSDPWVTDHVTFADLFSHRSGLPGGAGNDLEALGYDRATILQRLRYVPLQPFRITYSYSNFGMTLGGQAAADAANESWADLSQQMLFGPAGMTSTSMTYADFRSRTDRATLHIKVDGRWQPDSRQPDAQAPAGGVSSDVTDLGRWMVLQLNGGMLDGKQIIDESALNETHTPQVMNRPPDPITSPARFYGLGWNVETAPDNQVEWSHSGAFSTGAATTVKLIPGKKIGIVVLTNGSPIGMAEAIANDYLTDLTTGTTDADTLAAMMEGFSGLYGPKPDYTTPPNPTPARADAAYVGTYHNDYIGDVRIVSKDGKLQLVAGPKNMTFELRHLDGDTFLYTSSPELPDYPAKVTFDVGASGVATAMTDSEFESVDQATLKRT